MRIMKGKRIGRIDSEGKKESRMKVESYASRKARLALIDETEVKKRPEIGVKKEFWKQFTPKKTGKQDAS